MKKRLLSILICAALLLSLLPTAGFAAEEFSDMPAPTYWSYAALKSAVSNGLLQGSNGKLLPGNNLTRAQMAAVVNRAFGAVEEADISMFTDVKTTDWFYSDIAKAVRMGTFTGSGNGHMNPGNPITREQAFTVVARAMKLSDGDAASLAEFADWKDVSSYAVGPVSAMVAGGYVNGSNGRLNPKANITREQFAQIFYKVLSGYVRTAQEKTGDMTGNLMVNAPGAVLKDMKITGDLIIGEGVGNGEVTLDNVQVSGRMVVRGGGENSVILKNQTTVGNVIVAKTGSGGVRVLTQKGCRVEALVIADGKDDIILEGAFHQVAVETDAPVILRDAEITGLTLKAENAAVTVSNASLITAVEIAPQAKDAKLAVTKSAVITHVSSEAPGASLTGEGTVKAAEVSGENTQVDTKGTTLTVAKGTQGVTQNGKAVEEGTTVKTDDPGEVHIHDYHILVSSQEATCTEAGSTTYRCDCGETKTEKTAALGHSWNEGSTSREAACLQEGETEYTCTRCGEKNTKTIPALGHSWDEGKKDKDGNTVYTCTRCGETFERITAQKAYSVEPEDGQILWFDTLEAAMAEAKKHPNAQDLEYAPVYLRGTDSIKDLNLPSGYTLIVAGDLTLTGTITLGAGEETGDSQLVGARIMIPTTFLETKAVWNDLTLYDGLKPNTGLVTSLDSDTAPRLDFLTLFGAKDEEGNAYPRPWLRFSASDPEHSMVLNQDFDATKYFDGISVEDAGYVKLNGNLTFDAQRMNLWGGGLLIDNEKGALTYLGEKRMGMTKDCALQLEKNQEETNRIVVEVPNTVYRDGNVFANRTASFSDMTFYAIHHTLTVRKGVILSLERTGLYQNVVIEEGATLILGEECVLGQAVTNYGTLKVTGACEVTGKVINYGTLRAEGKVVGEDSVTNPDLIFQPGSALENNGTVQTAELELGDWTTGSFINFCNATVRNAADAKMINDSNMNFYGGNCTNNGTVENNDSMEIGTLNEQNLVYGEAEPVCTREGGAAVFQNAGTITNNGYLRVTGAMLTNAGTLINEMDMHIGTDYLYRETEFLTHAEGEPADEEEWFYFWDWDQEGESYWRWEDETYEVAGDAPAVFQNSGLFISRNHICVESGELKNTGTFRTENNMELRVNDTGICPVLLNEGTFVNGALEQGEDQGYPSFRMENGSFTNGGKLVNNGGFELIKTHYVQTANGTMETYQSAGLRVEGGSITVPSGSTFKNEGYMQIIDCYGLEDGVCDLDGFPDFFTSWNQEGNDSNWCEYTAQVYTLEGLEEVQQEQKKRLAVNPAHCYQRVDICGDITVTKDLTIEDIPEVWLCTRWDPVWKLYDWDTGEELIVPEGTEDAYMDEQQVGSVLTVAKGVTLTLGSGVCLNVDGNRDEFTDEIISCKLVVLGKLVTVPQIEYKEDDEFRFREGSTVQVWGLGSVDASGTIDNQGRFLVMTLEHQDEYWYDGTFQRPEECPLVGIPSNTIWIADVRTSEGFVNATKNQDFTGLRLRQDSTVYLREDLTIPERFSDCYIEPGSMLVVYDSTLTLDGNLHNDGDLEILGKLIVNGSLENNQNLVVGDVISIKTSDLLVNGTMRNHAALTVYACGRIVLGGNCFFENHQEVVPCTVQQGILPQRLLGISMEKPLTLTVGKQEWFCDFENCFFHQGIVLDCQGTEHFNMELHNNAQYDEEQGITVSGAADNDQIFISGASGSIIRASCPVNVQCGRSDTCPDCPAWANLNGAYAESETEFGIWNRDEEGRSVYQVDAWGDPVTMHGWLPESYNVLRLMQGSVDISDLDISDKTEIQVSDQFRDAEVKAGKHSIVYDDSDNRDGFHVCIVEAEPEATILVTGAQMEKRGADVPSTTLIVRCGGQEYCLNPHIFGTDDPSVYIGISSKAVTYGLEYDGNPITPKVTVLPEEEKTHLERGTGAWFKADRNLRLTVKLPKGPTVVFDPVPVKPESGDYELPGDQV